MVDLLDRLAEVRRFLANEVWPQVPDSERGRRLTRDEEAAILGADPADTL